MSTHGLWYQLQGKWTDRESCQILVPDVFKWHFAWCSHGSWATSPALGKHGAPWPQPHLLPQSWRRIKPLHFTTVKAWIWHRTFPYWDNEKAGCKTSSCFLLISAFLLYLIIFSQVMASWLFAFHLIFGNALYHPSNSSQPEHTSLCSVTGQLCVFMKQDQKGVNVNKLSLFEELLGIQSVLSIAMSTMVLGSCMLLIWEKKELISEPYLVFFQAKSLGCQLATADWSPKKRQISLLPDRSLTGGKGAGGCMQPRKCAGYVFINPTQEKML